MAAFPRWLILLGNPLIHLLLAPGRETHERRRVAGWILRLNGGQLSKQSHHGPLSPCLRRRVLELAGEVICAPTYVCPVARNGNDNAEMRMPV